MKIERAKKQHAAYAKVLVDLGLRVESLPTLPEHADGFLVEDAAVLLPEVAVIAQPSADVRRQEADNMAPILAQYRPIQKISGAGKLAGSDVLRIAHTLYVARTTATNAEGIAEFTEIVAAFGYQVRTVEIQECLHLKRACTFIPPNFLVVNPEWVNVQQFGGSRTITVDKMEPHAANTLTLAGTTLVGAAFPKTEIKLRKAGIITRRVNISELAKWEAGLTSLSLVLEPRALQGATEGSSGPRVIRTSSAPMPDGHYAQAIVHGGIVYVSGQLPINPETRQVIAGDIEGQTEQVLRNIAAILSASGSALTHVLRVTIYLADPKSISRVESVYIRRFDHHCPARMVLSASTLPKGCLLAMDVLAGAVHS